MKYENEVSKTVVKCSQGYDKVAVQTRASVSMDFSGTIGQLVSPISHCTTTRFSPISRISNGMDPALKAVALTSALNLT